MTTFQAIAYHKQTKRFVLIGRKKLQELHKNPNLLKDNTYQLIGTISEYTEGSKELDPTETFTADQIRQIFKEALQAVADMHASGVMHRDIKPANMLITSKGIKLIDFGESKVFSKRGHKRKHSMSGSVAFMSSARLVSYQDGGKLIAYDERVDLYGVAVSIYSVLFSGEIPGGKVDRKKWESYHANAVEEKLGLDSDPRVQALGDRQLVDLIGKLSHPDIDKRPFADEALRHPYFTNPQS